MVRFQEASAAFDQVAARVLGLHRGDLPAMTMLLFGGAASIDALKEALQEPRSAVVATVDRLQLAGYARRRPDRDGTRLELTEHARQWIARIWEPLREDGAALLGTYSTRELAMMTAFMQRVGELQERHNRRLRTWLVQPSSRRTHLRGGLSPAALRRVQLFVEANLEHPVRLAELADRAGLSLYHFARAFRTSAGMTPRAYVEQRRIERAQRLIADSTQPLADIAAQCGFVTQSRLTVALRRHTGFTPAAYRRGRRRSS